MKTIERIAFSTMMIMSFLAVALWGPMAAQARHGTTVGASGDGGELDPHERLADLFARLAAQDLGATCHWAIAGAEQPVVALPPMDRGIST